MNYLNLNITLGNDAMQTGHDVADALEKVATRLRQEYADSRVESYTGSVRDLNGNRVGSYTVRDDA